MEAMPHPRPPHLHRQVTRHGKAVWYVRIGKGPRVRIRAAVGSPEFDAQYQTAIPKASRPRAVKEAVGSLAWLIARYRETTAWAALAATTRKQRENIFRHVIETAGDQPFAKIDTATIIAGRDRRASTPAQARNFLDAMRRVFKWAAEAKLVKHDPQSGSVIRHGRRATASSRGPRRTSQSINSVGPSAPVNGCGSTCCSTAACAVAMPCATVANTFTKVWAGSRPRS